MSTLEILIALTVFTLSLTAIMMVAFGNQSSVIDTEMSSSALAFAESSLESSRAAAARDWSSVVSSSNVSDPFTESVTVSDADDFLKSIVSRAEWEVAGVAHSVELSTLVADTADAAAQGACASSAEGDWAHPSIASSVNLTGTTGPATGVDVKDGMAYITVDGDGALPDFYAVDVASSPAQILWSLNTGPGLFGVHVAGGYAYVANSSITAQLQIINLATHSLLGFKIPGSTSGDTANTLYYYGHNAYLGLPKSTGKEFHIIDVSNPAAPREVGSWEFNVGINAIYVSSGIAYVATPDAEEIKILDVHDPAHISLVGGYDAAGGSGNGKSFARAGERLYLGRTLGNDELYSLDINDIYNGAVARGNVNSSVNGSVAMGDRIFLATTDTTKDFQVWQTTSDPSKLAFVSSLDAPAKTTAVDCDGQTLYVTTADPTQGLLILNAP